jgi:hypothetical protein
MPITSQPLNALLEDVKEYLTNFYSSPEKLFPRQSLKNFSFRVKSSDLIFFLLGLSPIVN